MSEYPSSAGRRFAVVIVNFNGGDMLQACVHSALEEGVPQNQVTVVDNGSSDASIDALTQRFTQVSVFQNPCNAGFARAVNQGIKRATSEFVLLLNNDAQLERGALQEFAEGFDERPAMAIAGGQLRYPDGRLQSSFASFPSLIEEIVPGFLLKLLWPERFKRKSEQMKPTRVDCVLGACLCLRSSALTAIGLLDEDYFFYFEEIDWCRRAALVDAEVWYLPAARVVHGYGATASRFRGPSRVEYQRSELTYFRKTRPRAGYFLISVVLVLSTLVNAAAGVVSCIATLFLNERLRKKAATYCYLFCWNALFRPESWGLPGKCGRSRQI